MYTHLTRSLTRSYHGSSAVNVACLLWVGIIVVSPFVLADRTFGAMESKGAPATMPSPSGIEVEQGTVAEHSVLYPTFRSNKGGYVDELGRVVIPHVYEDVFPFGEDDYAVAWEKDRSLLINRRGKVVLRGEDIQRLGRGRFAITNGEQVRFIGLISPFRTEVRCSRARGPFSEGYISVEVDGKWGFMDELGQLAIQPMFDEVTVFVDGLAGARIGAKWGYLGHSGNWAIPPQFDGVTSFREGLAVVMVDKQRHHIDKTGRPAFAAIFADVGVFSEGLAPAQDPATKLYGFIDRLGNYRIPPAFRLAHAFSEGLAAVDLPDRQSAYISHSGAVMIRLPGNCRSHTGFWNGRASIWTGTRVGLIDKSGAWIWFSEEE